MGSISNSSSLRANISLRAPYNAYFFQPYTVQVNFFIYSAQKAYSRVIRNREFSKKYNKNLDGFNFSFMNSGKFCFSVRVFDKPVFFPGFFKSLIFKPKIRKYFALSSIIIKNSNFLSVKSGFFKFRSEYKLRKGKLIIKFNNDQKFANRESVDKFKYKNFSKNENKYKNFCQKMKINIKIFQKMKINVIFLSLICLIQFCRLNFNL